ncbi:putative olfactory receptor 2I1 [Mustela erminea]|uniref:putative olfactory receptor 2I1 n=2 Tax=Mustela erminea TaxID=36723 RepID=UPI001386B943|nr:putative olfactory receptor 2I1 [Mustela erminea]
MKPPSKHSGSFLPQANHSTGERFLLLGFSDWPALQPGLFVLVLLCYLLTLAGNSTLVLLAVRDPRLHTPMYYFLGHLALVDAGFTTSVAPALLASLCGAELWLPRAGCLAQLCTSLALGSVECLLLAVMALDRAAAVVHPLRHAELASPRRCRALACASWLGGLANSAAQSALLAARPLCAPRRLDHFICELPALLQLACGGDRDATERRMFAARVVILLLPSAVILASYGAVARAICGMRSRGGRSKALGTCGSHLTAVCLFYGSAIYTYLQPTRRYDQGRGKFVSLFYTVVTPALNPLIYTLRNKEVKGAARKLLRSVGRGQAGRLMAHTVKTPQCLTSGVPQVDRAIPDSTLPETHPKQGAAVARPGKSVQPNAHLTGSLVPPRALEPKAEQGIPLSRGGAAGIQLGSLLHKVVLEQV